MVHFRLSCESDRFETGLGQLRQTKKVTGSLTDFLSRDVQLPKFENQKKNTKKQTKVLLTNCCFLLFYNRQPKTID